MSLNSTQLNTTRQILILLQHSVGTDTIDGTNRMEFQRTCNYNFNSELFHWHKTVVQQITAQYITALYRIADGHKDHSVPNQK